MENQAANEHELASSIEDDNNDSAAGQSLLPGEGLVAPDIPIVRTSTPRPPSYAPGSDAASSRPAEEEDGVTRLLATALTEKNEVSEFAWLFEYGLEMDPTYLNSPERLNGLAHRYGPAVVSGYEVRGIELPNGRVAPTLVKAASQDHEVWGILYRIPRRLLTRAGTTPSALDCAHPTPAFTPVQVRAQETYRKRFVECITYIASEPESQGYSIYPPEQRPLDNFSIQQLQRIGKQQGLPATYLDELAAFSALPAHETPERVQSKLQPSTHGQDEQDTEPLPVLVEGKVSRAALSNARQGQSTTPSTQPTRWLFALALYLVLLLMAILVLAVIQALGYWEQIFAPSFAPLEVPWYVLLYGLSGGCISCMMSLGHLPRQSGQTRGVRRHIPRSAKPLPTFVVITWFARPYLGAILAALSYYILNSGLFLLSIAPTQRNATYAVIAAIAGLSEGRIFFRQR